MDLEQYVGKIMCHTPKAIKRGEPSDRLFFVVEIVKDEGKKWLLAWKVTRIAEDMISHPAFEDPKPLSLVFDEVHRDDFFTIGGIETDSTPTAMFRPDSLYQVWAP